jgi:hypothetical protein
LGARDPVHLEPEAGVVGIGGLCGLGDPGRSRAMPTGGLSGQFGMGRRGDVRSRWNGQASAGLGSGEKTKSRGEIMRYLLAIQASAIVAEMDTVDNTADDPGRPTRLFRHDRPPVWACQDASRVKDMVALNRAVPGEELFGMTQGRKGDRRRTHPVHLGSGRMDLVR